MKVPNSLILLVICFVVMASAYPKSKKPRTNEDFTNGNDQDQEDAAAAAVIRAQRQAGGGGGDHHDAVDFGAHTGDHGAFGWYADFPVHSH